MPAFGVLKPFLAESPIDLEGFHPNIVAGSSTKLMHLAEQMDLATINLSCVDHAVIAIVRCGQPPLTDVARVVLWQAFGVPVYEIFTGLDNSILGYECELHEGWHLTADVRLTDANGEIMLHAAGVTGLHTALSGFVTNDKCPCGRSGRRLLNAQPVRRVDYRKQWAAIA